MMKRILVIGSSGAGKSTFSRRLGEILKIEVVHLDKIYWQPNWVEPAKDEWKRIVEKELAKDVWIMDGNYGGTLEMRLEKCDTVIFLDLPRTLCVYRVIKRRLQYHKTNRPDMSEGCPEKIDWKFLHWIWTYPRRRKLQILNLLSANRAKLNVFHLNSKRQIEKFFSNLQT